MSGLAEVIASLGYAVQGSDRAVSQTTQHLESLGVKVFKGHRASQVAGSDFVVRSSAIPSDNVELKAARAARLPVVARADVLAELMRQRDGIAVAGTHGKTTTAHLIVEMLDRAGEDPTYVVGGLVRNAMRSKLGSGSCLVAEADESDTSFLHLQPVVAVVTNIDDDHLGAYGGNLDRLRQAFVEFAHNLPLYGLLLACADDPGVEAILPRVRRRTRTYGFSPDADYRGLKLRVKGLWSSMEVDLPGGERTVLTINLPGRHNALNALAVVALACELGIDIKFVRQALAECRPLRRRFELLGDIQTPNGQITLADDYAHHPREVAATLQAAREAWPGRRVVVAFQPHRYTRTRDLLDDLAAVLSTADRAIVTEVYPAGEAPISGADGRAICRAMRARGSAEPVFIEDVRGLVAALRNIVVEGDLVLTLGAGNIGAEAAKLPAKLRGPTIASGAGRKKSLP
ncbi:UDP-N-acetylmuramate--L-alanine ligase [Candidatus Foliamicus sp.]